MPHPADIAVLRFLRTRGHAPPVERAVRRFSRTGQHGALWCALALAGSVVDRRRRRIYEEAIRTVLLIYVINTATKRIINRSRPLLEDLPGLTSTPTGLAYPSAHASTSFAAARALSGVWPAPPLYAAAAAMAVSRPYLGVHYPSDVVAGAIFGATLAPVLMRSNGAGRR